MTPVQRPILLCLPAMGVPASYYQRFADALATACRATVVPLDLRGQGIDAHRARGGDDFGYREIVEQDIPGAVHRWSAAFPGRPIYLVGHSLGGQLAVLASASVAPRLAGLVLVAAGTACPDHWPAPLRWRARLATWGIRTASWLLPWYPGRLLGFGGDQPRRLMRDWAFNARTGRYRLEGGSGDPGRLERALAAVSLPVLSLALEEDPVAPPGAVEGLLRLLPAARVQRAVFSGTRAHAPWQRHFSWAREPLEVVAGIATWLERQARPAPAPPADASALAAPALRRGA